MSTIFWGSGCYSNSPNFMKNFFFPKPIMLYTVGKIISCWSILAIEPSSKNVNQDVNLYDAAAKIITEMCMCNDCENCPNEELIIN